MDRQTVCQRLDGIGIKLVELFDVAKDGAQLGAEAGNFIIGQVKTSEPGDMPDLCFVNFLSHLQSTKNKKARRNRPRFWGSIWNPAEADSVRCCLGGFVVSLRRLFDQAHTNRFGGDPDPADPAVYDGADLLDIGFEFPFCNTGNLFTDATEIFGFTASFDTATCRGSFAGKKTYS